MGCRNKVIVIHGKMNSSEATKSQVKWACNATLTIPVFYTERMVSDEHDMLSPSPFNPRQVDDASGYFHNLA